MPADPLKRLREMSAAREKVGLRRQLRPRQATANGMIDLASNDYLGLARHPEVIEASIRAVRTWGAGATGSRLVTGSTELHAALEQALSDFTGMPSALTFSSGYMANLAAVVSLSGPEALIVSDERNHASIVDGCRLSKARVAVFPHKDVAAVDRILACRQEEVVLVITDAVFSVDGDIAPLAALHEVATQHGALLLIDEAHALGVVGPQGQGASYGAGLAGQPNVVATATLSKSLGAQGGAVLGAPEVVAHLIDSARSFIFDTGLSPACVGAALGALDVLAREPQLPTQARDNAHRIAELARKLGLSATEPAAAVTAIRLGEPDRAVWAADMCRSRGIHVGCFRPPSVPHRHSCLRLTARANLTPKDLLTLEKTLLTVVNCLHV